MKHLSVCPKKTIDGDNATKEDPLIIIPVFAMETCSIGMIVLNAGGTKPRQLTAGALIVRTECWFHYPCCMLFHRSTVFGLVYILTYTSTYMCTWFSAPCSWPTLLAAKCSSLTARVLPNYSIDTLTYGCVG